MTTDSMPSIRTIGTEASVREALALINSLSGGRMTLFVTDNNGRVAGSLTDGDIRRGILAGIPLTEPVAGVMHPGFLFLREGEDFMPVIREARRRRIDLLPVLDPEGRLARTVDLSATPSVLRLDAVLMAGGRGERLRPLTDDLPKPLLPVGGRPIIDHNVSALRSNGVERIFVTVNYLKDKIIDHFRASDPEVVCVAEPKRMGTFGSLSMIRGMESPDVLVMNSDLLTDISFEEMLDRHRQTDADLTVACIPYSVSIPFAILDLDGDRVTGLSEKPTYNHFANAGVYIMRRELIGRIPEETYLDAPDFIGELIRDGLKVSYFPITGMWIDIGSPDDYRNACTLAGDAR